MRTHPIKKIIVVITYYFVTIIAMPAFAQKSEAKNDSIVTEAAAAQQWLSKVLLSRVVKSLAFERATLHKINSTINNVQYYMKIPYRDRSVQGFMLLQKSDKGFQYAQLYSKSYHYRDTVIITENSTWQIVYGKVKRYLKLGNHGLVIAVNDKSASDAIFKHVSFISIGQSSLGIRSELNVSLIFENITKLNNQVKTVNKIIQHLIPISFENHEAIELEYNTY
jgi:hypothetical protein